MGPLGHAGRLGRPEQLLLRPVVFVARVPEPAPATGAAFGKIQYYTVYRHISYNADWLFLQSGASNALKMWGGHCLSKHRLIQGKFIVGRCPWVPGLQGLACHSEKWGGTIDMLSPPV